MTSQHIERASYIAAHRLMTTDVSSPEMACPGARRTHTVDKMAAIIKGIFEVELSRESNSRSERRKRVAEPKKVAVIKW